MSRTAVTTDDPVAIAQGLLPLLEREAPGLDADAAFPEAGLAALRESGLMGLIVPREYGGLGSSYATMSAVASSLAEACMSTSLVWGMHCQQVGAFADHASEELRSSVLPRIAAGEIYVASVTSERGKGGHLLTALAQLEEADGRLLLRRDAPVVTGGLAADAFLVTMRANADAPPSDVELVWAEREELEVETRSDWNPMGARGTHSVALSLAGSVDRGNLVGRNGFREVALMSMVPLGHIVWASSWLGAARGAFGKMLGILRNPKTRRDYDVTSDLFATRLAEIRLELASVSAYLGRTIDEYERRRARPDQRLEDYEEPSFQLQINELKILASERLFHAVDRLVELGGLRYGYLRGSPVPLERVFRDLRSASLMYANERLLVANGKLALLDRQVHLP